MNHDEEVYFEETFMTLCSEGVYPRGAQEQETINRLYATLRQIATSPEETQMRYVEIICRHVRGAVLSQKLCRFLAEMFIRIRSLMENPDRVPKLLELIMPQTLQLLVRYDVPLRRFCLTCSQQRDKWLERSSADVLRFYLQLLLDMKKHFDNVMIEGFKRDYIKAAVNLLRIIVRKANYVVSEREREIITVVLGMSPDDDTIDQLNVLLSTTALKDHTEACINKYRSLLTSQPLPPMLPRQKPLEIHDSQLLRDAETLPVCIDIEGILQHINDNRISLIVSETGSGKSTQIPRKLVERYHAKCVVSTPRVVPCEFNAKYVAQLFGENVGNMVQIRTRPLKAHDGEQGLIYYYSTGTVQNYFRENSQMLSTATHLFIDEAHETNRQNTLLFLLVKNMLYKYPHLRVVIMSTTISEHLFQNFFGCSSYKVIAKPKFPIEAKHLDDFIESIEPTMDSVYENNWLYKCTQEEMSEVFEGKKDLLNYIECVADLDDEGNIRLLNNMQERFVINNEGEILSPLLLTIFLKNVDALNVCIAHGALEFKQDYDRAVKFAEKCQNTEALTRLQNLTNQERLGNQSHGTKLLPGQICQLIEHIFNSNTGKYVLVFLPGFDDIQKLQRLMMDWPSLKMKMNAKKLIIATMHSSTAADEHDNAFSEAYEYKIVLSTNICESSVTIPNLDCVIDGGNQKQLKFDYESKVRGLYVIRISKDSAKQRAGLVGRTKNGTCYYLYSNVEYDQFSEFQTPEVETTRIEDFCIKLKHHFPSVKIKDLTQNSLHKIPEDRLDASIKMLKELFLFDKDENLTWPGVEVNKLPLSTETAYSILAAIFFGCLEPVIISACFENNDPYLLYFDDEIKSNRSSRTLFSDPGQSDLKANILCYKKFAKQTTSMLQRKMCAEDRLKYHEMCAIQTAVTMLNDRVKQTWMYQTLYNKIDVNRNSGSWFYITLAIATGFRTQIGYKTDRNVETRQSIPAKMDRFSSVMYTGSHDLSELPQWSRFVLYEKLEDTASSTIASGLSYITPLIVNISRQADYMLTQRQLSENEAAASAPDYGFDGFVVPQHIDQQTFLTQLAIEASAEIFKAYDDDANFKRNRCSLRKKLWECFNNMNKFAYDGRYTEVLNELEQLRKIEECYLKGVYKDNFAFYDNQLR